MKKQATLRNLLEEDKLRALTFDETKFGQQIADVHLQPSKVYETEQLARLILSAIRRWPQFNVWRICPNSVQTIADERTRMLTSIRMYIYVAHDIDIEFETSGKQLICRRKYAWDKHGVTPDYAEKQLRAYASHEGCKPYKHCPSKTTRQMFNLTGAVDALLNNKTIRVIDMICWLEGSTFMYCFEDDYFADATVKACIDFIPVISNYTIDKATVRKYQSTLETEEQLMLKAILIELVGSIYETRAYATGWSDADYSTLPGNYERFNK